MIVTLPTKANFSGQLHSDALSLYTARSGIFQSVNLRQTAGRLGAIIAIRHETLRLASSPSLKPHLPPSWQLRANKIARKRSAKKALWCRQKLWQIFIEKKLRRNACEYENSCYLHHIALLAKSQQQKRFNGISYLLKTSKKIVITILFFKLYSFFNILYQKVCIEMMSREFGIFSGKWLGNFSTISWNFL